MIVNTVSLSELLVDIVAPQPLEQLEAVKPLRVTGLCLDSRRVNPNDLFVAIPGADVDGRDYLVQAEASGASAVLVDSSGAFKIPKELRIPAFYVGDLSSKVLTIAARFYAQPFSALRVVGVTGTNGKTSCSQLIAQLYTLLDCRCGVLGTAGWGIGEAINESTHTTPDPIGLQAIAAELVADGAHRLSMEVSSHALDQGRVDGIDFETAVFTNLSRDHLDYHGDMASYAAAKRRLFLGRQLRNAVINIDDDEGRKLVGHMAEGVTVLTYSLFDQSADLYVTALNYSSRGVDGVIHYRNEDYRFSSPLLGEFNVSNLLAAAGALLTDGITLAVLVPLFAQLKPARGRLQVVDDESDISVLVDYAHTPDALEQVLKSLRKHTQASLWVVFGCGGDRDNGKRPLMAQAACLADHVVVTSDNPRTESPEEIIEQVVTGLLDNSDAAVIVDRAAAIEFAVTNAKPGDCVVVAGKGHETYQDIMGVKHPFSDFDKLATALQGRSRL
ncbi:UDP-N-acetylmuramoylalanyl-D-glutamate--2,6-diaminopimelate ligase [Sinobacterium caligoides]|uniref:UDP-N-acetylmuramoyl-L-alanyl-D-glutamate--2,6-diaminopimelate ligase n=1 Tax=Sinobacterium caligoides TaxID=933926 RepID=A0A3N2D4Q8_9GAMM|nr:UDP-N-acetylmuramoyl-L-alanyl-D-glutamate--2,6-diaminopimelate ligase [Sinobacterium caligoides]ROR94786.1 UDP-N-acetylmuramoylalanyl-D-glutamate--2,6-diaminopimelate ligase [Sinobacterium caligoides]